MPIKPTQIKHTSEYETFEGLAAYTAPYFEPIEKTAIKPIFIRRAHERNFAISLRYFNTTSFIF